MIYFCTSTRLPWYYNLCNHLCIKKKYSKMLYRKWFCLSFYLRLVPFFKKQPFHVVFFCLFPLSQIILCATYYFYFENLHDQILMNESTFFLLLKDQENLSNFRNSDEKLCTICFEPCDEDSVCELNCPCHEKFYHVDCIKTWIIKNPSCPICREKVSI